MNVNQKIALKQTIIEIGRPIVSFTIGITLSYVAIYLATKLGLSNEQIVLTSLIVLFAGLIVYFIYEIYNINLKSLERENRYREEVTLQKAQREQIRNEFEEIRRNV